MDIALLSICLYSKVKKLQVPIYFISMYMTGFLALVASICCPMYPDPCGRLFKSLHCDLYPTPTLDDTSWFLIVLWRQRTSVRMICHSLLIQRLHISLWNVHLNPHLKVRFKDKIVRKCFLAKGLCHKEVTLQGPA